MPSPPITNPATPPADPFGALGLEPKFTLTSAEIERAYLARAGSLHPDRASGDAAAASTLNLARQTLKDPMARAEALLARLGGPAPSQDKSLPEGFLAEILDVREQLESALASADPAQRARWETWAEDRRRTHIAAITRHFDDHARAGAAALKPIRLELNVWRYTERVLEQLGAGPGGPGL